jgi:4-aminobutyrate aminotransferase
VPIVAEKARGSVIYDLNGDAYLDFGMGIAVNNVGHCHPKVVAAVQKQAAELIHTSVVTHHIRYIELAKKLSEISPKGLDSVFLANSGAEAIEGALKMARYTTGRPAFIFFRGSFHGRTLMTTAMTTSKLYYRERYEPFPPSLYMAPYPYVYRSHFKNDPQACAEDCLKQLDSMLHQLVLPEQVAAIIIEPILGEGGYVVPPDGFLKKLRKLATDNGIFLIIDEVQSGFGRSGKMFACEYENIEPDIMIMAKGIGGGMPLSAFIARKEITSKWPPGRHGNTFGGNPVSCAAGLASIAVIEEEKLVERAAKVGKYMLNKLKDITSGMKHVGDVRGRGLMIGIELEEGDGSPSKEIAERVVKKCLEHKLIVLTCGSSGHIIRLMPPLNVTDAEVDSALDILQKSMS